MEDEKLGASRMPEFEARPDALTTRILVPLRASKEVDSEAVRCQSMKLTTVSHVDCWTRYPRCVISVRSTARMCPAPQQTPTS